MTRVEFAVGPGAIQHRASERRGAMAAAQALDTRANELPEAVERVLEEREDLEAEVQGLREQVVEARLADLRDEVFERDGRSWLVGDVPSVDANDLADVAQSLAGTAADVVVLVGPGAEYMAAASDCDLEAGDVVARATDEFGGGGGGSPTVAQAGGLQADIEDVLALYRE
jgi:alanyl-tRNA synthetase